MTGFQTCALPISGAPQEFVFSPLLFCLYTIDCTSEDPSVKPLKFADNTTIWNATANVLNALVNEFLFVLINFWKTLKTRFSLCHYACLSVDWWGNSNFQNQIYNTKCAESQGVWIIYKLCFEDDGNTGWELVGSSVVFFFFCFVFWLFVKTMGRAQVVTPVTPHLLVCRLLLAKKKYIT